MSTKSLGVVIIAPEIIDYYYPYKYLVNGFIYDQPRARGYGPSKIVGMLGLNRSCTRMWVRSNYCCLQINTFTLVSKVESESLMQVLVLLII